MKGWQEEKMQEEHNEARGENKGHSRGESLQMEGWKERTYVERVHLSGKNPQNYSMFFPKRKKSLK